MINLRYVNITLFCGLLFLYNCTTTTNSNFANGAKNYIIPKQGSHDINKLISEVNNEMKLKTSNTSTDTVENSEDDEEKADIPLEVNERVTYWIRYFAENNRETFQRFLNRGAKYKDVIIPILKEQGVPTELYYLAMIESGFVIKATSSASARGIWQFITATAKRYDLTVDNYVDERIDPIKATIAAANYLKDLHNVFHSWYLAMAAYNAGEMRIIGSIMKHSSRNFWELAQKKALPKETMDYVPKFLAAAIIGHHPDKFGFTIEQDEKYPDNLISVTVPSPISISKVASIIEIPSSTLKEYNPAIKKDITSPKSDTYQIWLPSKYKTTIASNYNTLKNSRIKNVPRSTIFASKKTNTHGVSSSKHAYHKVRVGESLSTISAKYNIKLAVIKKLNNMKTNKIYVGKILKLPQIASAKKQYVRYKVKRGDNLHDIAQKNSVSIEDIKKENKLRSSNIRIGQSLVIPRG